MKSTCDDCAERAYCYHQKFRACAKYRKWFKSAWSRFHRPKRSESEYSKHLRQMYRDATFRRDDEGGDDQNEAKEGDEAVRDNAGHGAGAPRAMAGGGAGADDQPELHTGDEDADEG